MGSIFAAFALAYAAFEVPGGWMGDAMGPRKVLMRIVIWWSAFTALTGAMWSFASMWLTRFLFGAGEAGCFPNLTKAFSVWLPADERVRAQGIMWTFARWGGAFTPPLVIFVLKYMNWRMAFVLFGMLGAKSRDIISQVLTESITLSVSGGIIGVILGALFARGLAAVTPLPAAIEPWSIILGVVVTAVVGLFFGWYPARRAASLAPIEALRRE